VTVSVNGGPDSTVQSVNSNCPMSWNDQTCIPNGGAYDCDPSLGATTVTFVGRASSSAGDSGWQLSAVACN
jgi:hypothetical protein